MTRANAPHSDGNGLWPRVQRWLITVDKVIDHDPIAHLAERVECLELKVDELTGARATDHR